jgi:hypothetical protein
MMIYERMVRTETENSVHKWRLTLFGPAQYGTGGRGAGVVSGHSISGGIDGV